MGLLKNVQWRHFLIMALVSSALISAAQERTITGIVSDADDGSPLPGATILEKGTSNGTITDIDGRYQIAVTGDDVSLSASFVGFETKEISVGNQSVVNISLRLSLSELSEVVVIGYGVQQKKVATGSISKVEAKDLEGYKVPNVHSALDGQVTGVLAGESSGQPGSSKMVFIRGISTNGDNSPLYIVDGLTVDRIDNLNTSDIESIDVLKDAASTAIYGARAANGVIIITTKKGKEGVGQFTYEGFSSFSNPWKIPEMLNSEQYVEVIREKFSNGGQTAGIDSRGFPNVGDETLDTDWMDVIFNQATMTNHRMSASLNNSYLSLEYWDQNGVIGGEKSNYKRYAIRLNSTKKINDFFTVGENLYLNRTENQNIGVNNAFGTLLVDAFAYDPLTDVYDENAQYGFAQSTWVQKEYVNPLSRLFLANNYGHGDQVQGNVFIKFQPIDGLTLNSDLGIDFNWYDYRSFTPDYDFHDAFQSVNNSVSQGYGFGQRLQFENYANYQKDFGGHSINAVLGTTYINAGYRTAGGSTLNIPEAAKFNQHFQYLNSGRDTSDLAYGTANVDYNLISYFGRLLYDYKDKYLFSATLRRDGSSRFGANNKWGIFPSLSLGWVISDEAFFPTSFISFAKLRSSWGVNGNDRIADLRYTTLVKNSFSYGLGRDQVLHTGSSPSTLPNPNLKWEESVQFDVGLELKFLNNKLSTEFDYYIKTTKDLLGNDVVPYYTGVLDLPISNLGEFQNRGFEAAVSFRETLGDFRINARLNYTTFKNTVTNIPSTALFVPGWNWPVRNAIISRMTEGEPVGHFVGHQTLGIFRTQEDLYAHINSDGDFLQPNAELGDLIFKDVNGDGIINSDDITSIGSPWPDHIIGLNISLDFKGFDFNALFSTQLGHDIFRTYERTDIPFSNYQTFWLDRYSETNPNGAYPRLVSNDPNRNQRPSDFYVEDGSFLRLRNLQLGYNLPDNILEKLKLSGLRIYLTANNLLTMTKYNGFDPEVGTNNWVLDTGIDKGYYPSNKTVGAGIKISM
ncbi:MAG: TonB-dependent receptor [Marinoscillum sp.]